MRHAAGKIVDAQSMGADVTSSIVSLERLDKVAVHAVWTGTPTGNLVLQYSCDLPKNDTPESGVTNWVDVSTVATGGAAGSQLWDAQTGARWLRVKYTRTGSTGTLNVTFHAKEI